MSNALHFETTEGKNIINTANAMADAERGYLTSISI